MALDKSCTVSSVQHWVSTDERQHDEQVLAMELSSLDNGADICDFSQYPGMSGH
jgi:hypothetical protein